MHVVCMGLSKDWRVFPLSNRHSVLFLPMIFSRKHGRTMKAFDLMIIVKPSGMGRVLVEAIYS